MNLNITINVFAAHYICFLIRCVAIDIVAHFHFDYAAQRSRAAEEISFKLSSGACIHLLDGTSEAMRAFGSQQWKDLQNFVINLERRHFAWQAIS